MTESPQIRNCYEVECEHCQESGPISSCSYMIPQTEGHSKSPLAMLRGASCHYKLIREITPDIRIVADGERASFVSRIKSSFLRDCFEKFPEGAF